MCIAKCNAGLGPILKWSKKVASFQLDSRKGICMASCRSNKMVTYCSTLADCTLAVIVSITLCAHEAQGGLQCDAALAVHIIWLTLSL